MGKREAVLNLLNITYGLLDKVSGSFYHISTLFYIYLSNLKALLKLLDLPVREGVIMKFI